jgi:hypothetical protein
MIKNLFKHSDSTEDDIRSRTLKTHRLTGVHNQHEWQIIIGDGSTEIHEGAARFNMEKQNIVGVYENDKQLEDFNHKRIMNDAWRTSEIEAFEKRNPSVKKEWPASYQAEITKIEGRVPYSPLELSHIALVGFVFDLEFITDRIDLEEQKLMKTLGVLPRTKSYIPIWKNNAHGLQPMIKVSWNL